MTYDLVKPDQSRIRAITLSAAAEASGFCDPWELKEIARLEDALATYGLVGVGEFVIVNNDGCSKANVKIEAQRQRRLDRALARQKAARS